MTSAKTNATRIPTLLALVVIVTTIGCTKKNEFFSDAGPTAFSVGGTLDGLPNTGSVTLKLNGGEALRLSTNGAFQFEGLLDNDANYTVSLGDPPNDADCTLANENGTINNANVTDVTVTCVSSNADLSALTISSIDDFSPTFDSATSNYALSVSLLVQELRLTATAVDPNATIEINGVTTDSGSASSPVSLGLGSSGITVQVTASAGNTKTYTLDTVRGTKTMDQYAYGKASNTVAQMRFGFRVVISGDTMAVSAPTERGGSSGVNGPEGAGPDQTGAVFVFRRQGEVWTQEAYIKASNPDDDDQFGDQIALDGNTLVVGAYQEDSNASGVGGNQSNNALRNAGAAYVFRRFGAIWTQEAYLKASNPGQDDHFGSGLAILGDTIIVGAPHEDGSSNGIDGDQNNEAAQDSGAAYVFQRTGSTWAQVNYIKASNTNTMSQAEFGLSVALSSDRLVVGARSESSNATTIDGDQANIGAPASGAVYIFGRNETTWVQEAYLKAADSISGTQLGYPVEISGDTIATAAIEQGTFAGAVYVFRSDGSTWFQERKFTAPNPTTLGFYGNGISLSKDTLAIATIGESSATTGIDSNGTNTGAEGSGAVFVYSRTGSTWTQRAFVKSSNAAEFDNFGSSVALSGDTLAACADGEDSSAMGFTGGEGDNSAPNSGAVYVFH